ncbi:MAG: hypothetical protein K6U80_09585 [Firmicutes bacterium]|nr:hypothetical protein [Bacillota bacterium]
MAKKIKVEFEFDLDEVKALIEAGSKGRKTITEKELEELGKKGAIKAKNYLDEGQETQVAGAVSKAVQKTVDKMSNKEVQKIAVAEVVSVAVDKFCAKDDDNSSKPDNDEDLPKK